VITPSEMWHFYEEQMKRLEGLSQVGWGTLLLLLLLLVVSAQSCFQCDASRLRCASAAAGTCYCQCVGCSGCLHVEACAQQPLHVV
jgi:hypothetical protein